MRLRWARLAGRLARATPARAVGIRVASYLAPPPETRALEPSPREGLEGLDGEEPPSPPRRCSVAAAAAAAAAVDAAAAVTEALRADAEPTERPPRRSPRKVPTDRARALEEVRRRLRWLDAALETGGGPYVAGASPTHADATWHSTCALLEYVLPAVFDWPRGLFGVSPAISWAPSPSRAPRVTGGPPRAAAAGVILEGNDDDGGDDDSRPAPGSEATPLPRVTAWYAGACRLSRAHASARERVLAHAHRLDALGRFDAARREARGGGGRFGWTPPRGEDSA